MATLGEPLMDLGTALAYWIQANDPDAMKALPFGPTMEEGMLTRAELAERWSKSSKRQLQRLDFFVAFAHYKNAVVGQQIYWRFKNGHTKDERFAKFLPAVYALSKAALRATKGPFAEGPSA